MMTMTQLEARRKFALYFLDLKAATEADGGKVSKATEWETFVSHLIEEGNLPREASNWKCPKSLDCAIQKSGPSGGRREGAGRKPAPEHIRKVPYNTKLPRWLRDWLTAPERERSGPVLIEEALRKIHGLKPPKA